jgi:hypothetical protein
MAGMLSEPDCATCRYVSQPVPPKHCTLHHFPLPERQGFLHICRDWEHFRDGSQLKHLGQFMKPDTFYHYSAYESRPRQVATFEELKGK